MFIEIGSRLKILDPSPELIKWCKENLEMTNPEYQQKARMHLWLGNTPRTLYLYEVNGNSLILPFGCLRAILPLLEGDMKKQFKEPKKVDYGGKVPLYDYQEEAVAATSKTMKDPGYDMAKMQEDGIDIEKYHGTPEPQYRFTPKARKESA